MAANALQARVKLSRMGSLGIIPLPFDPRETFGKVRVPVKVTLNGYTYATTIASMGGKVFVPLRASHREAAGLQGHETLTVRFTRDARKRTVKAPPDLMRALRASPRAGARWKSLSYTHRREHAEAITRAKKPETRARRIASTIRALEG